MVDGEKTKLQKFDQLKVFQSAHALVLNVYRITSYFPQEEKFGLALQMRRAAVSVPANIAEGFKRRGRLDKIRFYNIAQGSLEELRYYFILCRDLGHSIDFVGLDSEVEKISKMLSALIRSVKG